MSMPADQTRQWRETPPTTQEIQAFAQRINAVREKAGLDPVEVWQVTACVPNHPRECMSAQHLMGPLEFTQSDVRQSEDFEVLSFDFCINKDEAIEWVAELLGVDGPRVSAAYIRIPDEIRRVTSYFDALARLDSRNCDEAQESLAAAFRDAGLEAE